MSKEKFTTLKSTAIPLPIENIDTDQIIPARFLKATTREGFGENLFRDWRYESDNTPKADFVLNNPTYTGKILVAGKNFGCGSSREHAVWAIENYGFKAVIAPSFADIFYNNCFKNGVLPIKLSEEQVEDLFQRAAKPGYQLTIDLNTCRVTDSQGLSLAFTVDDLRARIAAKGDLYAPLLSQKQELPDVSV